MEEEMAAEAGEREKSSVTARVAEPGVLVFTGPVEEGKMAPK